MDFSFNEVTTSEDWSGHVQMIRRVWCRPHRLIPVIGNEIFSDIGRKTRARSDNLTKPLSIHFRINF